MVVERSTLTPPAAGSGRTVRDQRTHTSVHMYNLEEPQKNSRPAIARWTEGPRRTPPHALSRPLRSSKWSPSIATLRLEASRTLEARHVWDGRAPFFKIEMNISITFTAKMRKGDCRATWPNCQHYRTCRSAPAWAALAEA